MIYLKNSDNCSKEVLTLKSYNEFYDYLGIRCLIYSNHCFVLSSLLFLRYSSVASTSCSFNSFVISSPVL